MPRVLWPDPLAAVCRMLSVSGPRAPKLTANFGGSTRKLYRWTRPCFCFRHPKVPADRRDPSLKLNVATQYLGHLGRFQPVIRYAGHPVSRQTSPLSVPRSADGVLVWNPLGASGGTQKLNSRRPARTLGQTRPARQGLVRVPESNTKYGGKGGITGGDPAPVIGATISESSGIPKGKIFVPACGNRLRPAVHRAGIFSPHGIALERLT